MPPVFFVYTFFEEAFSVNVGACIARPQKGAISPMTPIKTKDFPPDTPEGCPYERSPTLIVGDDAHIVPMESPAAGSIFPAVLGKL